MKKYLVDTTVFINHLRNNEQATKFLEREGLIISVVSIAELIQGARDKSEQRMIKKLIDQFQIDWGSISANQLAVKLLGKYFLKYNLRFLDAIIAAIALESECILVTDNVKHFKFIDNLKVTSPKDIRKSN